MEHATLYDLNGYLGIEVIEMFGSFLIADGNSNRIDWLKRLDGPEWLPITSAVPLVVICYVIGLLRATIVQACVVLVINSPLDISVMARAAMSDLLIAMRRLESVETALGGPVCTPPEAHRLVRARFPIQTGCGRSVLAVECRLPRIPDVDRFLGPLSAVPRNLTFGGRGAQTGVSDSATKPSQRLLSLLANWFFRP